jgi:ABC-2 type transport system permease protein
MNTTTSTPGARPGGTAVNGLRDTLTLAGRILQHWRRQPFSLLLSLMFPVLTLFMFGYLFGGAVAVPDGKYLDFLVPGMLAMAMLFGLEAVVVAVTTDHAKGVTERLRSMPVSTPALLAGRSAADLLNAVAGLAVLVASGLAVGWTASRGPALALAAIGLLLWLRFALSWIGIYLGLLLKTPEAAVSVQVLVWPVGFLSSAFVSPDTMPGWLGVLGTWNPMSATATAVRGLFGNPTWHASGWADEHAIALALAWPAVLVAIFLPLAATRYRWLGR